MDHQNRHFQDVNFCLYILADKTDPAQVINNYSNTYHNKLRIKLYMLGIFIFINTVLSNHTGLTDYVQANVTEHGMVIYTLSPQFLAHCNYLLV